jgi:hypothetical protein
MGTPNKYKKEYCDVAKKVLSDGESLVAVCCELKIAKSTLHEWRKSHPEFHEAIEVGLMEAQRIWEKIGRDGVVGNYDKFGAAPWIFTMKNRFREDYAEDKTDNKSDDKSVLEKIISGELKIKHD